MVTIHSPLSAGRRRSVKVSLLLASVVGTWNTTFRWLASSSLKANGYVCGSPPPLLFANSFFSFQAQLAATVSRHVKLGIFHKLQFLPEKTFKKLVKVYAVETEQILTATEFQEEWNDYGFVVSFRVLLLFISC